MSQEVVLRLGGGVRVVKWHQGKFWGYMALLGGGLILSIMSLMGICSDACSEAHKYVIFNAPVAAVGIGFFAVAMTVLWTAQSRSWAQRAFAFLLASAAGAEAGFIIFQDLVIGHFCTLCLWIGAVVVLTISAKSCEGIIDLFRSHGMSKSKFFGTVLAKGILFLCAFVFVLGTLKKPVEGASLPDPFLGNSKSPVEIFFITDWFCPACRRVEPVIESSAKEAMKLGRVTFVDFALHPETFNFSPYNLSFSMYEKSKYLELRKTLEALAMQSKNPSAAEVQSRIAPLNVKLHPLDFTQALTGVQFYQKVVQSFKVTSTPTVIVRNVKTGKMAMLNGKDIAAGKVIPTVKMVLASR